MSPNVINNGLYWLRGKSPKILRFTERASEDPPPEIMPLSGFYPFSHFEKGKNALSSASKKGQLPLYRFYHSHCSPT